MQIAKGLLKGLENGEYHIKTSDFLVNLLISSTSNITPKIYPGIFEACMAPAIVGILAVYRKIVDGYVIRQRRREQKPAQRVPS